MEKNLQYLQENVLQYVYMDLKFNGTFSYHFTRINFNLYVNKYEYIDLYKNRITYGSNLTILSKRFFRTI